MKIQNISKHRKKSTLIAIGVALLILSFVSTAVYMRSERAKNSSKINFEKATSEQIKSGDGIKKSSLDNEANSKNGSTGSDSNPAPTPASSPGGKPTVGIEITSTNRDGGTYRIRSFIKTVTNTGTCSLRMEGPNQKVYTSTAEVQAMPSSSTCKGFDVPMTELSTGSWKIILAFSNNELEASTTKEVVIQ